MKNTVRETIDGNGRPENLIAYISWLQAALERIPEESRAGAYVDFEVDDCYGCHSIEYRIKYERLETDEEYDYRTRVEQNKRDLEREKELRLLEELKAKYEPKPDDKKLSL